MSTQDPATEKKHSIRALEASSFFLADVQTGLGPFLAAYLASSGWAPGRVGFALTLSGIITVVLQTPAGAFVDKVRAKRTILAVGVAVLACGALLLSYSTASWTVYLAQTLIGGAAPFLAPTLAAITMGLVGTKLFDRQFGRNQSFNSAGNVASALVIAAVSHYFGNRAIFLIAAALTIPTIGSIFSIKEEDVDYDLARGGEQKDGEDAQGSGTLLQLLRSPGLGVFLGCAFLFHFANAAMLPQLGEMLAHGAPRFAAAFMSACVIVTQFVIMCSATFIARVANQRGRKPLLLVGFGVLPFRAFLYTVVHGSAGLIGVQLLDGVANAIFGVVAVLVVADLTRGTGRFNLVQGALATAIGLGASLSTTFGGKLIQAFSFRVSFLGLGTVAVLAFLLLLFAVPETLHRGDAGNSTKGAAA